MIEQAENINNQYGFYVLPKINEGKKKFYESFNNKESQYSDEEIGDINVFVPLNKPVENEDNIERDYFVDERPYSCFRPKEKGQDVSVQIELHDLFDYQLQVRPLIEILVGRSVVQAINQLQDEKELDRKKKELKIYKQIRNAELMLTQRLQGKSRRKIEEANRRKLQKELYTRRAREAGAKILARKNAKHQLINLKEDITEQLEKSGFLHQSLALNLKICYEQWLYQQATQIINSESKGSQIIELLITEVQKEKQSIHLKHIQEENQRRRLILEEREKVKKQNQLRKQKKRIRKHRLQLNKERSIKFNGIHEEFKKSQSISKILKSSEIGNGFTKKRNTLKTVQVTGGLLKYILVFLNEINHEFSIEQIQGIFWKLLQEMESKLEFSLLQPFFIKYEGIRKQMEQSDSAFMMNKEKTITNLIEEVSLDLSLIEALGIFINTNLHNKFLHALFRILLTIQPKKENDGDQYEITQKDKKNLEIKQKIQVTLEKEKLFKLFENIRDIVRVHFERLKAQDNKTEQNKSGQEWIDIFDGEGWKKNCVKYPQTKTPSQQSPVSYHVFGSLNSLVIDFRHFYYLKTDLEKLFDFSLPENAMRTFEEEFMNIQQKLSQKNDPIAIYDIEFQYE